MRTEVDTLRKQLTNHEFEQKEQYKNALRSREAIHDVKENELRYFRAALALGSDWD